MPQSYTSVKMTPSNTSVICHSNKKPERKNAKPPRKCRPSPQAFLTPLRPALRPAMTAGKGSTGNGEKTRRQRIIERLEAAYETARKQKEWVTVRLAQFDNFSLCVVIAPPSENRDATPVLVVQSPRFKNRLIIKDQDAFSDLAALIDTAKKDTELLGTVFSWLDSKNPRARRKTAIIEL